MEFRETRALPEGLDEASLKPFLATLVAQLGPELERSGEYLPLVHEPEPGAFFSAEAALEDGTLIVVTAEPRERSLTLLVTDAPYVKLVRHLTGRWTYLGVAGVVIVGFAAATWADSAVWGTVVSVSVSIAWVAFDLARKARLRRSFRVRPLDVESWRARFDAAVAAAREAVLR
jgi:hypothetical protein